MCAACDNAPMGLWNTLRGEICPSMVLIVINIHCAAVSDTGHPSPKILGHESTILQIPFARLDKANIFPLAWLVHSNKILAASQSLVEICKGREPCCPCTEP